MLDAEANRELFEEQLEIILKAFNQASFSHQGKYYTIPPPVPYRGYQLKELTLVPRPAHLPVEIWQPIVSGSARGLEFMVRHGIKGVVSATAEQFADRWFHDYQAAARAHGRELALGEDLILGFRMSIDDTQELAVRKARPYFEEHAKFMGPLGMLRYSEEHVKAVAERRAQSPTAATIENGVQNRTWLCGPAEEFIGYLKEVERRYPGLEHVMVQPMILGLSNFRDLVDGHPSVSFFAHPALAGASRIDPALLFGKIFRMLGADAIIFPNHGGRFGYSAETCRRIADAARAPWHGREAAIPVPAGGMTTHRVGEMLDFYGADVMLLIGGALLDARARLTEETAAFVKKVKDHRYAEGAGTSA